MIKIVIICVIIIIVFLAMLASRSQALQRFAVLELALALAVSGSAALGCMHSERFVKEQYLDMYGLYVGRLSTYMQQLEQQGGEAAQDADAFAELLDAALPVTTQGDESYSCLGASIVERQGSGEYYQTVLSTGAGGSVYNTYREQADELLTACMNEQQVSSALTDADTGLLALVDTTQIAPKYGLVVEVSLAPLAASLSGQRTDMVRFGAVLLLTATLLLALIIYLQGRQVHDMVRIITKVASGKARLEDETPRKGLFGDSNEMRALRNSLAQLMDDNYRANYTKYQMLQAYYRFAPKKIEKILKKSSILDVEIDDQIRMNGTVAIVSAAVSERLNQQEAARLLNENYQVISRARDAEGGIFLCGNADLSEMCSLFPDAAKHALQFGIDVITGRENARQSEQTFVLLHYTDLTYGVAGDDKQASAYLLSGDMRMLERYTGQLRAMGIRMAVTDSVYELVGEDTAARYIGFVERGRYSFKLYEILDAYPAKERQNRLETKAKFQEALNLFYRDDFYLARSLFTEVLKENPTDEVAKWYLFICEKYLDQGSAGDISYGLFSGE
jgi:hypothetical protein